MARIGLPTYLVFVSFSSAALANLPGDIATPIPPADGKWPPSLLWTTETLSSRERFKQPGMTKLLLAQAAASPESATTKERETPTTPDDADKKKEGKPAELKKKDKEGEASKKNAEGTPAKGSETPPAPAVLTRPQKPEVAADPSELDHALNEQGRIRFNFSHQPWPAVLEWLAGVSHLSLDWQELPADYLNLQTQRDYSIEEARDLINHHLLARGFTMLKSGEMLSVVNISKLNTAMVPRVAPEELDQQLSAEFVKVSFPLKWMLAERAVEELKPMLSPHGKLFALKEVNRVEALDAAGNLQEIHRLLQQTQSEDVSQTTVVKEFRLQHRRASDVVLLVESILGLEPKRPTLPPGRGSGGEMMSYQIMNQLQQMQQQMQQGQRGGQNSSSNNNKEPEPRLIVNDQENSILAHATPDKLEIISQTIKAIDVPGGGGNDLLHSINRVKPYRLSTADPQPIMALLKEMGNLSPQSRIQVDEKSKSLILYGTLADHYTTQTLIERLDGTNRNFEVVPLRRLRADAVAGTIQYLMGAEDEEKNKNTNNRWSFYSYQPNSSRADKEERPFKVDADIVNNRLLLWANDVELGEVRQLLIKMGETPPGASNPETMRTLELPSEQEAERLLQRLKQLWPEVEPNPLQIQKAPGIPQRPAAIQTPPQTQLDPGLTPLSSRETPVKNQLPVKALPVKLAWWQAADAPPRAEPVPFEQPVAENPETSLSRISPPISIRRLPDGRIIYSSPDTKALDRLEDLIAEISPPTREYQVFQLKYPSTWAYGIELILEDFFEDKSLTESFYDPWWGTTQTTRSRGGSRLSRQKDLKIISNDDSHTILVQGATPDQLKIIGELIEIYDRPTSNDPQSQRKTEVFQLQYSRAPVIAEAVKQVYRDLLSANDPALQNPNQQQKPSDEPKFTYIYGRQNTADNKDDNPAQPIKFKGLLSVGVDEISNTVIISSTEGLMHDIRELITRLDEAAKPAHAVQVLQVRNINPAILQQRLERTFSGPAIRSSETGQRNRRPGKNDRPPGQEAGNDSSSNSAPSGNGNNGSASP